VSDGNGGRQHQLYRKLIARHMFRLTAQGSLISIMSGAKISQSLRETSCGIITSLLASFTEEQPAH